MVSSAPRLKLDMRTYELDSELGALSAQMRATAVMMYSDALRSEIGWPCRLEAPHVPRPFAGYQIGLDLS